MTDRPIPKTKEEFENFHAPHTGWGYSDHDPRAQEIYDFISWLDYYCENDFFCWKSGGDGDNGEVLLGELDGYFAWKDGKDRVESSFPADWND